MDFSLVDPIARAILYEGYLLYPYRTSSLKNRQQCAFGSLVPKAYSLANGETEPWSMQTECLIRGDRRTTLQGVVRFLHAVGNDCREVTEREVPLPTCALDELATQSARIGFTFSDDEWSSLEGCVELSVDVANDSVYKVRVRIANESRTDQEGEVPAETESCKDALVLAGSGSAGASPSEPADVLKQPPNQIEHTMLSTHAILGVDGGRFLSLIDPPADVRALAETCRNRGLWPVLVGACDREDMMLAAPIILYDFPQIAPESPGNLFDGTEIDELLTLRILTLTASEKQAMQGNERTRALLERTEKLASDQLLALHGAMRAPPCGTTRRVVTPGVCVRLRPLGRADILDLALEGKRATIASIEQDFEGRVYYTVTLDDDPGQDLGIAGKPGHRFFFRREELELLAGESR